MLLLHPCSKTDADYSPPFRSHQESSLGKAWWQASDSSQVLAAIAIAREAETKLPSAAFVRREDSKEVMPDGTATANRYNNPSSFSAQSFSMDCHSGPMKTRRHRFG